MEEDSLSSLETVL